MLLMPVNNHSALPPHPQQSNPHLLHPDSAATSSGAQSTGNSGNGSSKNGGNGGNRILRPRPRMASDTTRPAFERLSVSPELEVGHVTSTHSHAHLSFSSSSTAGETDFNETSTNTSISSHDRISGTSGTSSLLSSHDRISVSPEMECVDGHFRPRVGSHGSRGDIGHTMDKSPKGARNHHHNKLCGVIDKLTPKLVRRRMRPHSAVESSAMQAPYSAPVSRATTPVRMFKWKYRYICITAIGYHIMYLYLYCLCMTYWCSNCC